MSDSLTYIENLKKKLHIAEESILPYQLPDKELGISDFCKFYSTNIRNSGMRLSDNQFNALNQDNLTLEEKAILQNFSNPYRQREWFFGRLLAKIAIFERLKPILVEVSDLNQIEIHSDSSKKPQFKILNSILSSAEEMLKTINFSISHKKGMIGSISSLSQPVGIDIETRRVFSATFSKNVFSPSDLEEYHHFSEEKGYKIKEDSLKTGIWCLKEATSKAIGLGLSVDFKDLVIKYENGKLFVFYDIKDHIYLADFITKDSFFVGMVRKTS